MSAFVESQQRAHCQQGAAALDIPVSAAQPPKAKPLPRVDELDGLRGLLSLWVAVSHIFCWCGLAALPLALPHRLHSVVERFWVQFSFAGGAVDTFIILSGFAISFMLHARPLTYRQFITGRFFRIYPVYLVCLLAGFLTIQLMSSIIGTVAWRDNEYFNLYVAPVLAAAQAHSPAHFLAHLTLLFGIIPEKILPEAPFTFLAPAWSITLEWQYYLLAPFLAWFIRRPAGLLVLGMVGSGAFVYEHFWSPAFLPARLPLFLIGIGSYHLYANAEMLKGFRYRKHVIAALIAATLVLQWHWLALLIWIVVFGGVLAGANHENGSLLLQARNLLLRPALQFVGKISYPLYLVHWPVIIGLMALLVSWNPDISSSTAMIAMLAGGLPVILFAAWLLHKLVEKPLMQYGKRFSK